jgi:hypothetical protein
LTGRQHQQAKYRHCVFSIQRVLAYSDLERLTRTLLHQRIEFGDLCRAGRDLIEQPDFSKQQDSAQ